MLGAELRPKHLDRFRRHYPDANYGSFHRENFDFDFVANAKRLSGPPGDHQQTAAPLSADTTLVGRASLHQRGRRVFFCANSNALGDIRGFARFAMQPCVLSIKSS